MPDPKQARLWPRLAHVMWIMLALWAVFSFFVNFFVSTLDTIVIFGFPLGFYMAAQGSLIAFVVMLFWFAKAQDRAGRDRGGGADD